MMENNLYVSDTDIFYGGFWIDKPAEIGKMIAEGILSKPDAIVCASDMMAISITNSLIKNGISVPEEVKITGYDAITETLLNEPSITTVANRDSQFGVYAAKKICSMICQKSDDYSCIAKEQKIIYGASCGCHMGKNNLDSNILSDLRRLNAFHFERYTMMSTDFIRKMTNSETLEELMFQAAAFSYRIPNWENLYICLCDDLDFSSYKVRNSGFTDTMLVALEKRGLLITASICENKIDTRKIIPSFVKPERSYVYFLTSLHCQGQIFGYICTSYTNPNQIYLDEHYCNWCDIVSRGLLEVGIKTSTRCIKKALKSCFYSDLETGLLNITGLKSKIKNNSKNKEYIAIVLTFEESKNSYPLKVNNLMISAIKNTAVEDELIVKLHDNIYLMVYPFKKESDINKNVYERIDDVENEILSCETNTVHIELPIFAFCAEVINESSIDTIDTVIENLQNAVIAKLNNYKANNSCYLNELIRLRNNMKNNLCKNWCAKEVAEEIHISKSHFQRIYKKTFGVGFHEDLIKIKLDKARRLLLHSNMKISEIAYFCGYCDASTFMKKFKSEFGITALQYRKNNNNMVDFLAKQPHLILSNK